MKVYLVMSESWNGEYDYAAVYAAYANKEAADFFVNRLMSVPRGPYSTRYWVDEIEVII
jgi:hypothetical protein